MKRNFAKGIWRAGVVAAACGAVVAIGWAADSTAQSKAGQAPLSDAAVQKAMVNYKQTADDLTLGRSARSTSGPFKPAAAAAAVAEPATKPTATETTAVRPAATRATSAVLEKFSKQAEMARVQGNWSAALQTWSEAEKEARTLGDRTALAQAAVNQARLLQSAPPADAATQRRRQDEIIAKYQTAVEALPRPEQAFARNNLAVAYLQTQTPAAARTAAEVMKAVDWTSVDPEQLALCRFNFGRAEETAGNVAAAVRQYRMALEREPDFAPAVEAVFRVLATASDAPQIADVGNHLVQRGEAAAAVPRLRDALVALAGTETADAILVSFVRACAEAAVTPDEFAREHAQAVAGAGEKAPALRGAIAELGRAFASELPVDFSGNDVRGALRSWTQDAARQQAMSRLLQAQGDFHGRAVGGRRAKERGLAESRRSVQRALVSYVGAWALDRGNTDAPLYAAAVLQEHREIDPDGAQLNALIGQLFRDKGEAIGIRVKSADDLRNLMRLHLVLGTIFEREKKWGPTYEPRSATFRLSHAIALSEELRKADPTFVVSADLYARAARAHEQVGEPALALEFHTKAAEAYLHFRDAPKARLSCEAALALPNASGVEYRARLNGVAEKLREL